jgi:hypothetical protein
MKYAHIDDKTNKILGWYSDDIHSEIPTPNIEVSDEVWQEALNTNANCYEDGEFIVKDFRTESELLVEANKAKVQEAMAYLISTGWYIERLNDPSSGKAVPQEVLDKRAAARVLINELEG